MAATQIICTNCGAKYRIPETFKGNRAKCKACGTVIDVAAQRDAETSAGPEVAAAAASAKPAAARPARAKPADPRPRHSRRSAGSKTDENKTARSSSRGSRSPRSRAGSASSGGRRGRASAAKNSGNKGMLIGGGLLVVALAVIGVIYMMGGDEGPTAKEQAAMKIAAADEQARLDAADKAAADQAAAEQIEADAAAVTEAAEAQAIEASANKDQTAAAPTPAKRKKGEPITDASQVFDPKSAVEPVPWPADMSNDEIDAVSEMIEDFKGGGRAGIDAKKLLQELGHKALPGIVNALRELDYLDSFEVMTAWEFNKFMEQLTDGTNVGFRPSDLGEPVPLDKADWNARIVVVWRKFALRFNNAEEWEKLMQRNKKR